MRINIMKTKVFILATMIAFLTISVSGQKAKTYYKAGNEFVDNLKYEDAVAQFTSAIGLEPANTDYYLARANALEMLNKYNEAYADYEKAIVFKPKESEAYISLGRVCNKLNKFDQALAFLNHAAALDKRNSMIYPEKVLTLYSLGKFEQALKVSDTAVLIKDDPMNFYYRGRIYVAMNNDVLARKELEKSLSKDKKLIDPHLELAELLIRTGNTQEAMNHANIVISIDDKNTAGYLTRSKIYKKALDFPSAINDVSKVILIDPTNPDYYLIRALDYQEFNQHANAINDFTKYISLKAARKEENPDAYYARAKSYEDIMNLEKAIEDYNKIAALSEDDPKARKLLREAKARLYELNRETVPPEITLNEPVITNDTITVKGDKKTLTLSGKIKEKSKLDTLVINNQTVTFQEKKNGEKDFITNIELAEGVNKITILARDEYKNQKNIEYFIKRTEINPPIVSVIAPYSSEDGQVYVDIIKPTLFIEGKVEDESLIKSIEISGVSASYRRDQTNPGFTASIDVANINRFTVTVEDIYGNKTDKEFSINRDNAILAQSNPMGKTWVVFIENSSYKNMAALDGPTKDVNSIQRALANYQISRFYHKKDMTKAEMEKFFNIELRDELKANQVKSLLVWYAGHGKFINDVGYWIPVDANKDDEFTYFNINQLKAGMQGYAYLTHTLVVSDACESGPSFYQAMRAANDVPTCDNVQATTMKSAQVFSSAGYELASDVSQFTTTFANTLINNKNACIPIETVVKNVSAAVGNNNQQKPKFGKISGLQDENGTFFFIAK
jgi:tetratricopeptide (TPR) repeat protein